MHAIIGHSTHHNNIAQRILEIPWPRQAEQLQEVGYTIVPGFLTKEMCREVISMYEQPGNFRKTVSMARHRFGIGEYKYFKYPLPAMIAAIREHGYPPLAGVANAWNRALRIEGEYPAAHGELIERCRVAGQLLATPLILKYGEGGYNTLHQDLYGKEHFPMQALMLLSETGVDFTGGEFVLLEQLPRAQSRARVLILQQGDCLIFTTRYRPVPGARGYYRVNVKHGISEIRSGTRFALGVIFHDAVS